MEALMAALLTAALIGYNRYRFGQTEKQYPPRGEFVAADGIKLHYLSKGDGKPVVFLHGGVLTGSDFEEVLDLAAAGGYRGIAFDRPGYGYSERPRNGRVTLRTQAALLHQALAAMGAERPILVGHSWSGALALAYALEYPDDVSGIVTLGGGMYAEGYPAEKGDPISSLVTMPVIGSIVMNTLLAVFGPPLADFMLKATFRPEPVPEAYRRRARAFWLRPNQFRANREDVLAFVPAVKAMAGRYRAIRTPLVIAVGEDDPFETKEHSYRLHDNVPGSRLIALPCVAHMIPQLHPEAVMEAIEALPANAKS